MHIGCCLCTPLIGARLHASWKPFPEAGVSVMRMYVYLCMCIYIYIGFLVILVVIIWLYSNDCYYYRGSPTFP